MLKKILAVILMLLMSTISIAGQVNLQVDYAYNGPLQGGFTLYMDDGVVASMPSDTRQWIGEVSLETGRHIFYLVAHEDGVESPRSEEFPFEYLEAETPGNPPPTVIIKFY